MMNKLYRLFSCLIVLLIPCVDAHAITATVTNTFSAGQKIVASQINTNYNDILSAINGQLASDNILAGGIATSNLADLLITTGKIATSGVTTAKIADANVTNAKLATLNYASSTYVKYTNTGITATPISSKTITSVGRPVMVRLVNSQGGTCLPFSNPDTNVSYSTITGGAGGGGGGGNTVGGDGGDGGDGGSGSDGYLIVEWIE